MTDPAVTAALISAIAIETVALIGVLARVRNNKKNHKDNPGTLHDVIVLLTEMNGKLDELLRRK